LFVGSKFKNYGASPFVLLWLYLFHPDMVGNQSVWPNLESMFDLLTGICLKIIKNYIGHFQLYLCFTVLQVLLLWRILDLIPTDPSFT
jgi:hypothetical protein